MSPRLSHLLETSLYVEDLHASKAFYRKLFGLDVLREDERMVGLELPGSSVLLLLRKDAATTARDVSGADVMAHDATGSQHLCMAIELAMLPEWERHMMVSGVVVESRVIQPHGGTSLYLRDPDGHSLELATPGLWPNA